MNLEILFEDKDIIVVKKPAGIATQTKRFGEQDMESLIKNHLARHSVLTSQKTASNTLKESGIGSSGSKTKKSGPNTTPSTDNGQAPYLATIHRLDQPVTGILIFAKTPFAAKELNKQLTTKGFGKHYRALVCGTPDKPEDILSDFLVRDGRTNTSHICSKDTKGAKAAQLSYKTVQTWPSISDTKGTTNSPIGAPAKGATNSPIDAPAKGATNSSIDVPAKGDGTITELDILLDTGRHHQIRVQLSHMGNPIVGDTKYGIHRAGSSLTGSPHKGAYGAASSPDNRPRVDHPETSPQKPADASPLYGDLCLVAYRLEFVHPRTKKAMTFSLI